MKQQAETARFKVASHILEDLGLSLYTSVARVLVEFVANSYDADSSISEITYDREGIERERQAMREQHKADRTRDPSLGHHIDELILPDEFNITIEDNGHGMSRKAIEDKFLIAGRRRLEEEPDSNGASPNGRPLMGRKGLGKLAGFGVAKLVEVTSRAKGETSATKIILDFDKILDQKLTEQIEVPIEILPDGGALPESGGTRIVLSRLLLGPMKNRQETVMGELAEHFAMVDVDDFGIICNGTLVEPAQRELVFGWPSPKLPVENLVSHEFETEDGDTYEFKYRLRFTGEGQALRAQRRGIRVYTNKRLCSAPSLLDADTNMHGFRMTDYMDGVVHADFIADQKSDYIATDRQGLRWESPLLQPLHKFLSAEIKKACSEYQKFRDSRSTRVVQEDPFTLEVIEDAGLSARDKKMALKIASMLHGLCKQGASDPEYTSKLPALVQGIGHGTILTAITELAGQEHPNLDQVILETTKLTHDELGRFMSTVKGRLRSIEALRKIVTDKDFKAAQNEKEIQKLLEKSAWIINPTFTQFLSADSNKRTLFARLAQDLEIGEHTPKPDDTSDERPDLVFLIGSESLQRLVVVELKSANLPLESKHLDQLILYMSDAEQWLNEKGYPMRVEGILLGSRGKVNSTARGVRALRDREKTSDGQRWVVRDYLEVLDYTECAHAELIEINSEISDSD